jgi:cell pole-organizing protein PopZ
MSEPLSNPEIEDVVSSIRRLVSTDARPRSRDLAHDKLILTSALRVVSEAEAEVTPAVTEAVLAEEPVAEGPETTLHLVEAEWEDQLWEEPEPSLAEIAEAVEDAEIVLPEAEVAPVAEAWPASVAEPLAAWGETGAGWAEEQQISVGGWSSDTAPEADAAAVEVEDVLAATLAEAAEEQGGVTAIDESVLHDIVRKLIREELQGDLGERITRNVRKLVRAEINRALAARAYE